MKILIAAIHAPVSSGRYMAWAFQRLGHQVLSVGPTVGGNVWNMSIDAKYNWSPNFEVNKELIGHALDLTDNWIELEKLFRPDLVLTIDSQFSVKMGRSDIPHALFGVDNHLSEYRIDNVDWDQMFLAHSTGFRMDEKNVQWLPCAYDPIHFTPSPIAWDDRDFDVCLVGWISPRRAEVATALIDAGYKVKVVTGLLYEEFAAAYHNARISLCVSVAGDLAQRIFETSALHCTILSDTCVDFERVGFRPWEHYVPFDTVQDAVLMTKKILVEPKLGKEIADNALAWVQPHTWDARGELILDSLYGLAPPQSNLRQPPKFLPYEVMSTTRFFRNRKQIQTILNRHSKLNTPTLNHSKVLLIGCSIGCEAYSLAIDAQLCGVKLSILAVDYNSSNIISCNKNIYDIEHFVDFDGFNNLSDDVIDFFDVDNLSVRVRTEELSSLISFKEIDVMNLNELDVCFDLIICNNVLIHFPDAKALEALDKIYCRLSPGGLVALGGINLDILESFVIEKGLTPFLDNIEEIWESWKGDRLTYSLDPKNYCAMEPLNTKLPNWRERFSTLFIKS